MKIKRENYDDYAIQIDSLNVKKAYEIVSLSIGIVKSR